MPSGHAYSGAALKIRDKAIEEQHSKTIAALDARYERLRHAYDKQSDEHFASVNYGHRIAELLGFRSLTEVQTFMELADEQVKYQDLAKRVDELKAELAVEKRDKEAMEHDLIDVTEERDLLKVALAEQTAKLTGPSAETLAKELVELQSRYNEVTERAARADAEIKERVVKWRGEKKKLNSEDKIREGHTRCLRRREKMKEVGLDDNDPTESDGQETPIRNKIPPVFPSSPAVKASTSTAPAANDTETNLPSSPYTRTPLQLGISNQYSPPTIAPSSPMQSKDIIDLSETDDDSQGSLAFAKEIPAPGDVIVTNQRPATTPTTGKFPAPHSTLPTGPKFPQFGVDNPKERRNSNPFAVTTRTRLRPENEDTDHERPRKIRRFSSPVRAPLAVAITNGVHTSRNVASPGTNRGRENRVARENVSASTPANTSASKQLTDYSAFKGRGRYGKAAATGNDTINASYAIDPARNEGVDFQYDAVVRRKEDRKRMDGGDCECCREYYEAIGPMPNRLQPPLWRSPKKSSSEKKPCRNGEREGAIHSHKQAISRHRHNWAQGSTPPGYWNIAFPSTQEAQLINEKAAEMQQQKMRMVQREAENGG
ncbi:DNA repair protein endonuclease SAE2/CtIP C-terminus-domain-containing protein, partial [Mycena haematopus]